MKVGPYFVVLLLALACLVLGVALIPIAISNQRLQVRLQAQQQALNQGVLGPQAQQTSGALLQDLAAAAAASPSIKALLEKYGYTVQQAPSAASATNAAAAAQAASARGVGETP